MLSVKDVQKSFDRFLAVKKANLEVERGEIVAVIGPNGAGKSTLFGLIAGRLAPDKGRIIFKGKDIGGLASYLICRRGLSMSFQIVNVFNRLTVFENVQVSVLSRLRRAFDLITPSIRVAVEETREILKSVGLSNVENRASGSLSHGERKVLEIAIALGANPELLILDEPTAGMAPDETASTIKLLEYLNSDLGLTILFCEHDIELVFSFANRVMVMRQGVSIIQGTPQEVKDNEQVREAYLGGS
ncbi:MAG: ABC transporter ATP-binding protein [Syntrophaceae bacterium]|nr:ABC transporter ATP-binding protein [Syntrophaceae bacterium]